MPGYGQLMDGAIREERFPVGPPPRPPGARCHAPTGPPGLGAVHVKHAQALGSGFCRSRLALRRRLPLGIPGFLRGLVRAASDRYRGHVCGPLVVGINGG